MRSRLRPSDVARELGRSISWLRDLERKGIIAAPERDELSGHRIYKPEDIGKIREAVLNRRGDGGQRKVAATRKGV